MSELVAEKKQNILPDQIAGMEAGLTYMMKKIVLKIIVEEEISKGHGPNYRRFYRKYEYLKKKKGKTKTIYISFDT